MASNSNQHNDDNTFPYIDPKLILKLRGVFPDKLPNTFDKERVLRAMGSQDVIRFLESRMNRQQEEALGPIENVLRR